MKCNWDLTLAHTAVFFSWPLERKCHIAYVEQRSDAVHASSDPTGN
jgi:hypothetical protein